MASHLIQPLAAALRDEINDGYLTKVLEWCSSPGILLGLIASVPETIQFYSIITKGWGCEVLIPGDDHNARYIIEWIREHLQDRRFVNKSAQTYTLTQWDSKLNCSQNEKTGRWRYNQMDGDHTTRFEVGYGSHIFFYKGRVYVYTRKVSPLGPASSGSDVHIIRCLTSFSTGPVQSIIIEAREQYREKRNSPIEILVPAPKKQRSNMTTPWISNHDHVLLRSLGSVDLDPGVKNEVIDDINQFLAPNQAEQYQRRGIAYRKSYLFFGKPGTGKSSFVTAIASQFGLNIYMIPLNTDIAEDDLRLLLARLPSHCLLLFEDIDQAGLGQRELHTGSSRSDIVAPITPPLSLSGFLNAIGGISTIRGAIIIFTTNRPETLDEALTRPGRIDYKYEFKEAGKEQVKSMFMRMCARKPAKDMTKEEVIKLTSQGDDFAAVVGEGQCTTAVVEGHLLSYLNEPDKAIAAWNKRL